MPTTKKTAAAKPADEKEVKKPAARKTAAKHAPSKTEGKPAAAKAHVAKPAEVSAVPVAVEAAPAPIAEEKPTTLHAEMQAELAPKSIGGKFIYAIGRRKSATAKVKMYLDGKGEITVNGRPVKSYFPVADLMDTLFLPLRAVGMDAKVTILVEAMGGGQRGQAEAARLGISRALIELVPEYRKTLKKLGFLMRDPREKERKKPGLKRARKGSQWAKR